MGIAPEQIKNGLEALTTRTDKWPPNAVEFRQLCLPESISPNGGNADAYLSINDPRHSCYQPKGIEDLTKKAKAKAVGQETLTNLKDMFK